MITVKARVRDDEPVTELGLAQAVARGRRRQDELRAASIRYLPERQAVWLGFADQSAIVLPVANYPELAQLSVAELNALTLEFGGSALCLEARDLHLSITGLAAASHSLMEMAASLLAARP